MKKLILVMVSLFVAFQGLSADASDRFIVFTLGGGVNGVFNHARVTENIPVNYVANPNYTGFNLDSRDNPVNRMCKSGSCDISQVGGGITIEAGLKLRFDKFVEFDLWGEFGYTFMVNGTLPNAIKLRDGTWTGLEFDYKYSNGGFTSIESTMMRVGLNATATLRLGKFGIIGGIGGAYQGVEYSAKLQRRRFGSTEDMDSRTFLMRAYPIYLIAGVSYVFGANKGDNEVILRFSMPFKDATSSKSGNNGYVDYNETYTTLPYTINFLYRRYF